MLGRDEGGTRHWTMRRFRKGLCDECDGREKKLGPSPRCSRQEEMRNQHEHEHAIHVTTTAVMAGTFFFDCIQKRRQSVF
ncbi:uncharacterized protein MYCFIDRAFT_211929 [Pseudocercospora fijiensis CIRAD86]|uniref:Uncharacterized protein n=1 Tax=Pseudocercospora fijiensis (strain CIRAD86) TaxID=383855 RepID=M3A5T8_PSEFD|nr:uncharacterized protein MYCFIDRAFT_211929 [Pseudocercospora fijiensis CIRAD86]EME79991.1 hypothetical protein MYCFIDRAFT_211929 [Pseudocercospora fijiensis CIRAD86]